MQTLLLLDKKIEKAKSLKCKLSIFSNDGFN